MVWGAIKDAAKTVANVPGKAWKGITGTSDSQRVKAPEIDQGRFVYGGGREEHSAGALAADYTRQAEALSAGSRTVGRRRAPRDAAAASAIGRRGFADWQDSRQSILAAAEQQGPSLAEAQLQAGQDAAMRQQLALARSGRGAGGEAAAMRQAAWNNATLQAQTNQAAAQLRAQEEAAHLQRQMQALQYVGGQDASLGQFGTSTGLQGELSQRQLNDARSGQLLQASLATQGMRDQTLGTELGASQQYELARTGNIMAANQQNAQTAAQRGNALIGGIAGMVGAGLGVMSDERSKQDIQALTAENQQLRRTLEAFGAGSISDSDRRALEGMSDLPAQIRGNGPSTADVLRTVREARPYTYEYRDPQHGEGRFAGPMAQDLERTPLGRSMVQEGPDGMKRVDGARAGLTALAASSAQQDKLDQLEKETEELRRQMRAMGGTQMPQTSTPNWLTGGR